MGGGPWLAVALGKGGSDGITVENPRSLCDRDWFAPPLFATPSERASPCGRDNSLTKSSMVDG
ncbi:MAG: hypothetical protein AAB799_00510, partial [Patescibacteria group bacterium]